MESGKRAGGRASITVSPRVARRRIYAKFGDAKEAPSPTGSGPARPTLGDGAQSHSAPVTQWHLLFNACPQRCQGAIFVSSHLHTTNGRRRRRRLPGPATRPDGCRRAREPAQEQSHRGHICNGRINGATVTAKDVAPVRLARVPINYWHLLEADRAQ